MQEMMDRINGQSSGKWHDPHNNGTYDIISNKNNQLELKRLTGDGKYTDKMLFTFSQSGNGNDATCNFQACSESQVTSIADFGTNYCNVKMMYCNDEDNCKPVDGNIAYTETSAKVSSGATKDMSKCMMV